ncbi:hypothetical protein AK812_SmicGene34275 [Symbiodinium microadriaticum]|uniref:Uncharacterized protein n=1 Tax=Symbiodinium microadriaticum TaxID=2951 RepID=A0A1Q9CPJ2_SYMMI|nr:hypothetical protein AK812_SmicGene34275 [Symbiodinium microadriaticum]CAE7887774.1 unnamed protein product [Symbiodinium microadriaticum]
MASVSKLVMERGRSGRESVLTEDDDVYEWPEAAQKLPEADPHPQLDSDPDPPPELISVPVSAGSVHLSSTEPGRCFSFIEHTSVTASDWRTPSPMWTGILQGSLACQFPHAWHRYWCLWSALHSHSPWSPAFFRGAEVVRAISPDA